MDSIVGIRKALVVGVAIVIACTFVITKGDIPPNLAEFLKWAVGLFVVGNIGEHAANAYSSPDTTSPSTQPVDMSPVVNEINYIKGRMQQTDQTASTTSQALAQGLHQVLDAVSTVQQTLLGMIKKMGLDRS